MNVYRNKITGAVVEIASEFGNADVWERIAPPPAAKPIKAESVTEKPKRVAKPKAEEKPKTEVKPKAAAPKKTTTTKKAVKK